MKKIAIVGVEGSGKTVMLAGLGELYTHPDAEGYFLAPKDFGTASYVMDVVARMRGGEWPSATAEDVMRGLDWTIKRVRGAGQKPEVVGALSCLDFAGEVYRAAFGIRSEAKDGEGSELSEKVGELRSYIRNADALLVLINLRDVIANGCRDRRVQESMWITNAILNAALGNDAKSGLRAAIVLSQADSYADTIRACGGEKEVLRRHLPHVYNNYSWLDTFAVSSVDRTVLDAEGNRVPARDFTMTGLVPIMDWVLERSRRRDRPRDASPSRASTRKQASVEKEVRVSDRSENEQADEKDERRMSEKWDAQERLVIVLSFLFIIVLPIVIALLGLVLK